MEIERLKMAVSDGDRISAAIFKTLQGILSGPVALLGLMDLRVLITVSTFISAKESELLTGFI
jgi:hypothetical protein